MNDLFLRACKRQPISRTPVWMMRQAGRYLPEYQAIRAKAGDFLSLCQNPALATEVTLQPIDRLGVDAAILFSDILVVPQAMGMSLRFEEGRGPIFPDPLRDAAAIAKLTLPDPNTDLDYVMDTIVRVKDRLAGSVPLIGFCGAPWTLAAYMIEGSGSRDFGHAKTMLYTQPDLLHHLLDQVTESLTLYLNAQVAAGAQALQIFDTWGGLLSTPAFRAFSLPYLRRLIGSLNKGDVPVILFVKGGGQWLEELADTGAGVLGLDWTIPIGAARARVGDRVALQGNMDPGVLLSNPATIQREVQDILLSYGPGSGHVMNLGHGITPTVPVANAQAFITATQELSGTFHTHAEVAR
ncbi:MAG: uroporphyrinogen decarboxylase [Candidatus Sericytochromatia bacterium]|nr:uroporphyrinogen decarboxylase [Candidatus Sericytochromatia bacterium]